MSALTENFINDEITSQHESLFSEAADLKQFILNDWATAQMSNFKPILSERLRDFKTSLTKHFEYEESHIFKQLSQAHADRRLKIEELVIMHRELTAAITEIIFKLDHKGIWEKGDFDFFTGLIDLLLKQLRQHEAEELLSIK